MLNPNYIVIKYGGNALTPEGLEEFAINIKHAVAQGFHPIIVHGGGPGINQLASQLKIPNEFKHGYRVTNPQILETAQMVLVGKIAPQIIGALTGQGLTATSINGSNFKALTSSLYEPIINGETINIGLVGTISETNIGVFNELTSKNIIPVISPIIPDKTGQMLNINADTLAGNIAAQLKSAKLILLTDVIGVMSDYPDENSLITNLTLPEAKKLLTQVDTGMIPKLTAAIEAVESGSESHICDGRTTHALRNILTANTLIKAYPGTTITGK